VGYLGIMSLQDGIDHALHALAWLSERRDDWHAILAESRVSAGAAATYARPGDPADFGAHLDALLDDPPQRRRMGELGRGRVREALAWQHSVPALKAAYDRALELDGRGRAVS
jgi:hypothetical protein